MCYGDAIMKVHNVVHNTCKLGAIHSYIQACVPVSGSGSAEKMVYQCTERGSAVRMMPNMKHFRMAQKRQSRSRWTEAFGDIWSFCEFQKGCRQAVYTSVHDVVSVLFGYEYHRARLVNEREVVETW